MAYKMRTYLVSIKGITPLLMNRPPAYIVNPDVDSNIRITNPNVDQDKEVKNKIYSSGNVVFQPASHIRGAMMNAAKAFKVVGRGKATYSKMFASMVEVEPENIPHKETKFDVSVARTVNPSTKGMNMARRPMLRSWSLDFQINVDDEIPESVLKEVLDRAGRYIGIGDWRPDTKGVHGKFMVTKFKLANERAAKTYKLK